MVEPKGIATQLPRIAQGSELLQAPPTTVCDDGLDNICCIHIRRCVILIMTNHQLFSGVYAHSKRDSNLHS